MASPRPWSPPRSASAAADAIDLRDGQCIGISDRTPFGQGAEQNRIVMQRAIHEQNAALDPDRRSSASSTSSS